MTEYRVENDNAEADAIEGIAPDVELYEKDTDYRRRYDSAVGTAVVIEFVQVQPTLTEVF